MAPGRTYSFVMWAGNAKGPESREEQQADGHAAGRQDTAGRARGVGDRHDLLERRPLLAGGRGRRSHLLHVPRLCERHPGLDRQPGVDRRAGRGGPAARGRDDTLASRSSPSTRRARVAVERGRDRDHAADQRHDRAERSRATSSPGTSAARPGSSGRSRSTTSTRRWRFATRSSSPVVSGLPDEQRRWITNGTQSSNTFSVQAIDSAGNRSAISSVWLDNQAC